MNQKSLNLACANKKCKAKANAKISPDLIIEGPPKKRGNKLRSSYKVDYSNQRMRDLSNYVFIEHNSPSHSHPGVKSGILGSVKRDFRERHSRLAVATGKSQVDTVLDLFRLRSTYGVQVQSEVLGRKKNELKSACRKIERSQVQVQREAYTVPLEFREIFESNFENLGAPRGIPFYQGSTQNVDYFYLERELNLLQNMKNFCDGTFHICKNLLHSQIYICLLYTSPSPRDGLLSRMPSSA